MSTISTEELYYGEKYHVFGRVCEELLTTRKPDDYDAQTWLELLLVTEKRKEDHHEKEFL